MSMDNYNISNLSETVYVIIESDSWNVKPNIYLILGSERHIVIDSGVGSGDLVGFIRKQPTFKDGNLLVINTSNLAHLTGANYQFSAVGKMGRSHKVEDLCASGANQKYTQLEQNSYQWEVNSYRVTRWLNDNETISLGNNICLKVLFTPGITPDSISLWYESESRLFTGNLFYQIEPISLINVGSDLKQYANSINRLLELVQAQNQPAAVRYSAGVYDNDQPCLPVFKIFQRFLYAVIIGTVTPTDQ
ncbi:unnamed protein product [Bursaphelenchus okinawaensis]|uniref:Metallo-beta-lactamase domain-containing protein n=1 Tax=Bursaphelenchus okinawaensis TaxID=465554 RepID=A0A811LIX4_9BILA|nr:unnamed protein product [Bursaphelenchus okinawaensis]CAG9126942.1 unnamed protein product [Bursaphelenchus okinawaensis]